MAGQWEYITSYEATANSGKGNISFIGVHTLLIDWLLVCGRFCRLPWFLLSLFEATIMAPLSVYDGGISVVVVQFLCCFICFQSDYGATAATPASSAPPFLRHKAKDDMSMGLCKSLRLLHRTFSDEVKHRRRDSMPASLLSCSQLGE